MGKSRFSESHGIVGAVIPVASSYNTGFTGESVNMGKYNHGTLILMGDAAIAGAGILTMMAGASNAAATAAITFTYRYCTTDIMSTTADVYSTPTTSAALTLTEAYMLSGTYVIEWDTEDMNVSGVQYNWITPVLDATGTAGFVVGVMILSEPRYQQAIMPTAVEIGRASCRERV